MYFMVLFCCKSGIFVVKKEVKMVTVYYCVGVDFVGQPIYVVHYLRGVKL